jgi:hypothetical protein
VKNISSTTTTTKIHINKKYFCLDRYIQNSVIRVDTGEEEFKFFFYVFAWHALVILKYSRTCLMANKR